MCSILSFKQGTIKKFLPPFFKKTSFALKFISSKVSIQSEENPGHIIIIFSVLDFANSIKVSSV